MSEPRKEDAQNIHGGMARLNIAVEDPGADCPAEEPSTAPELAARSHSGALAAQDVAQILIDDINISSDLSAQQKSTGLNKLLKAAIPLTRLDASSRLRPALLSELLPYVGNCSNFLLAVNASRGGRQQLSRVVAVVQASGSGKSRLAYEAGHHGHLVVFIRLWKQQPSEFTSAWQHLNWRAKQWHQLRSASPENHLVVSQMAMTDMRLLIACYVEWVALVLAAISHLQFPGVRPKHDNDEVACYLREAALRCLRNGRGDAAVGELYKQRLQAFAPSLVPSPSMPEAEAAASYRKSVKEHCAAMDKQLRKLLWPEAEVLVWYDEANALLGTPDLFIPLSDYKQQVETEKTLLRDGFYGLMLLMPRLSYAYGWQQSLCGTWLQIYKEMELSKLSPLRDCVKTVFHASRVEVEDMIKCLDHYFDLGGDQKKLEIKLAQLRGRPIFFFDYFWTTLWGQLSSHWTHDRPLSKPSAGALLSLISQALDDAIGSGSDICSKVVTTMWNHKLVLPDDGGIGSNLCAELYAAAMMSNGQVTLLSGSAKEAAVKNGLLALPGSVDDDEVDVDLGEEPLFLRALLSVGNGKVIAARKAPEKDPVFQLLHRQLTFGNLIKSFDFTKSAKGGIFELTFAWHLLRSSILAGSRQGGKVPLTEVLQPLAADGFHMPEAIGSAYVVAKRGMSSHELADLAQLDTDFHFLADDRFHDVVLINADTNAGADVIFRAVLKSGQPVAVMVQAKASKTASLLDCLRAATPAWQYTTNPERKEVLEASSLTSWLKRQAPIQWSTKRQGFTKLVSENSAMFANAVRVAFSVNDYASTAAPMCVGLNKMAKGTYHSPIVLCVSSEAAFGPKLHKAFQQACKGLPTHNTDQLAFLLPQSVAAINRKVVVKKGNAGVQALLKEARSRK